MEIPLELMLTVSKKLPWMFFPDIIPIGHPIFDIINSTDPEVMSFLLIFQMQISMFLSIFYFNGARAILEKWFIISSMMSNSSMCCHHYFIDNLLTLVLEQTFPPLPSWKLM